MKKFLFKTALFTVPVLLLFLAIELFIVLKPNSFNTKAEFIENNLDIKALFLGSSHTQNAINPEFFDLKTANLAYGGQDYTLDSALFFRYVSELKDLRYVFLEVDYHSLEHINDENYFRNPWYYKYHDLSGLNLTTIEKSSLFLSNPTFFKNYLTLHFDPDAYKYEINEFGFVINDFPGVFQSFDYDSIQINATSKKRLKNRHRQNSIESYVLNTERLLSIINYCHQNNIQVVLLKLPIYQSLQKNYMQEKNHRRLQFIDSLVYTNKARLFDYENSDSFTVQDFKNDDHLNSSGAKKLSLLVNQELKKLNLKPIDSIQQ